MSLSRRDFLKLVGLGAAGLAVRPAVKLFADVVDIPEESPLIAKRWAMVVNLKLCREQKGCTACIDACHSVHNVPDWCNPKDEVKWIWKESFEGAFESEGHPFLEEEVKEGPTLVLCNHCDSPACVRVCPTQATWKRESDGIVMMDWHRCIGCRYCMVACPYGARSFNWRDPRLALKHGCNPDFPTRMKGVVEKCTFCEERLSRGQIPACVEACPAGALTFGDLDDADSQIRELLALNFTIRRKPALGTSPQIYYLV